MEVEGLREVVHCVPGLGEQIDVSQPSYLSRVEAQELAATSGISSEKRKKLVVRCEVRKKSQNKWGYSWPLCLTVQNNYL